MESKNVSFVTLGCAKNEVDSDKMSARLVAGGFNVVEDVADADLVIVNTCSFLVSAVDEGLDVIFDIVQQQQDAKRGAKVLVAGCMPARYGADLEEELSEVAGFLSVDDEEHVVEKVEELIGKPEGDTPAHLGTYAAIRDHIGPSAYVKVSDGCDRFCTYCMIPYIRGRYHSYPMDKILREVGEVVEKGTKEVVFIGQDTGIWGHDLDGELSIVDLVSRACAEFPETWFRVMYMQPAGITDELLELMASTDNFCSYLDIPLQHADHDVLERMNRKGSVQDYLALVERIRSKVPSIAIRTTLMAGFPGETDEQFNDLLDFVGEARFDYAGVFAYSSEEGSRAAEYADQIDDEVKIERAQQLLDACDACGHGKALGHIGQRTTVLVEGYEETDIGREALGRAMFQAPEVDGQIHIPIRNGARIEIGDVVDVEITNAFCYELEAELV